VSCGIKVLNSVLREDFGFEHLLFVFSGNRGGHCWVSDAAARNMTDEERKATIDYINLFSKDAKNRGDKVPGVGDRAVAAPSKALQSFEKIMCALTEPLYPAHERAFRELEPIFERFIIAEGQQEVLSNPAHFSKILDMLVVKVYNAAHEELYLCDLIEKAWDSGSYPTAADRWAILKDTVANAVAILTAPAFKLPARFELARYLKKLIPAIVFSFTYARLDMEVSKKRNHLLKSPFCIHPKSSKVCVPIDARVAEQFDTSVVPTAQLLMDEANTWLKEQAAAGAPAPTREQVWQHTSIKKHVDFFSKYLDRIRDSLVASRREQRDAIEAQTGSW
jgi:DNA primase small subunit